MIKTEYICDHCKKSQPTPEQMWNVGVDVYAFNTSAPRHWMPKHLPSLFCRSCVDKFDLLTPKKEEPPAPPITIEDIITEICGEMIERAHNQ